MNSLPWTLRLAVVWCCLHWHVYSPESSGDRALMVSEMIVFLCFITNLSPDLMPSKPLLQWNWTPGREYSQVNVTASPSLASTAFRSWVNSAGMAKRDKNGNIFTKFHMEPVTKLFFGTFYSDDSLRRHRSSTALVHPSIAAADFPNGQSSFTVRVSGEVPGGVPHHAAVFVPDNVAWLGSHTGQNQTTSLNGFTVLQGFDDSGTPFW